MHIISENKTPKAPAVEVQGLEIGLVLVDMFPCNYCLGFCARFIMGAIKIL